MKPGELRAALDSLDEWEADYLALAIRARLPKAELEAAEELLRSASPELRAAALCAASLTAGLGVQKVEALVMVLARAGIPIGAVLLDFFGWEGTTKP